MDEGEQKKKGEWVRVEKHPEGMSLAMKVRVKEGKEKYKKCK